MSFKNIVVTKHAVIKYKERMFDWEMSDQEAEEDLERFIKLGKITENCPGGAVKVKCGKHVVIASFKDDCVYVITYLGDGYCRKWFRQNIRTGLTRNSLKKIKEGFHG